MLFAGVYLFTVNILYIFFTAFWVFLPLFVLTVSLYLMCSCLLSTFVCVRFLFLFYFAALFVFTVSVLFFTAVCISLKKILFIFNCYFWVFLVFWKTFSDTFVLLFTTYFFVLLFTLLFICVFFSFLLLFCNCLCVYANCVFLLLLLLH